MEIDQWQIEKLALVTQKAEVFWYVPGLPEEYHPTVWGRVCGSMEAARDALFAGLAPGSSVAVIPEGPYVLAKVG